MAALLDLWGHHTFQVVFWGSSLIGFSCGSLGTFAYIRNQGMLGDTIAHATLPGVVLSFMVFKQTNWVFLGALLTGFAAITLVHFFVRHTKTKEDSIMGLVLSVSFGCGILLLSIVNQWGLTSKSGLRDFLFGMASSLMLNDLVVMGVFAVASWTLLAILWKPITVAYFDGNYAETIGIPTKLLTFLTLILLTTSIVMGLEMAGVVLVTSLVIAPATAARQWTNHLGRMFVLSGLVGAAASAIGATTTSIYRLPTGPVIVVVLTLITVLSLALAPKRGLLWWLFKRATQRQTAKAFTLMSDLLRLAQNHPTQPTRTHSTGALKAMNRDFGGMSRALRRLEGKGLLEQPTPNRWRLSKQGLLSLRATFSSPSEGKS